MLVCLLDSPFIRNENLFYILFFLFLYFYLTHEQFNEKHITAASVTYMHQLKK